MFGYYAFGVPYFGDIEPPNSVTTASADYCGGAFGSVTFGSPYFGQLIDCGDVPPVPPVPPTPVRRLPTGGGRPYDDHIRRETDRRREERTQREDEWPKQRQRLIESEHALLDADEEDIATILSLWLNLK